MGVRLIKDDIPKCMYVCMYVSLFNECIEQYRNANAAYVLLKFRPSVWGAIGILGLKKCATL